MVIFSLACFARSPSTTYSLAWDFSLKGRVFSHSIARAFVTPTPEVRRGGNLLLRGGEGVEIPKNGVWVGSKNPGANNTANFLKNRENLVGANIFGRNVGGEVETLVCGRACVRVCA